MDYDKAYTLLKVAEDCGKWGPRYMWLREAALAELDDMMPQPEQPKVVPAASIIAEMGDRR